MHFQHAAAIWRDFPALVPGVLYAENITADKEISTARYEKTARTRLASGPESELPEIGTKPFGMALANPFAARPAKGLAAGTAHPEVLAHRVGVAPLSAAFVHAARIAGSPPATIAVPAADLHRNDRLVIPPGAAP